MVVVTGDLLHWGFRAPPKYFKISLIIEKLGHNHFDLRALPPQD